ncbi:hypothetical protein [Croceicoccus mobilis]|uniref:Uncharacterized protein n=1 Tax=Croceicoccus mobilis TaxID=1703339 RepID=A0A916Z618_9SPHN|nr:hypothetical protein [Croceicoccus mobilis]GGD78225.1 hypothetical protein GCM10010990_30070 [Croceicoccus mobilis]
MVRAFSLVYLAIGIVLCALVVLGVAQVTQPPNPMVPQALNWLAMPGALLQRFVFDDQPWMQLLVWGGSVLINFGLLAWLADNMDK